MNPLRRCSTNCSSADWAKLYTYMYMYEACQPETHAYEGLDWGDQTTKYHVPVQVRPPEDCAALT